MNAIWEIYTCRWGWKMPAYRFDLKPYEVWSEEEKRDKRKAASSTHLLRYRPFQTSWEPDDRVYWFDNVLDTPLKYLIVQGPPDVEGAYQKVVEWYDEWLEDAASVQAHYKTKRLAELLAHGKQDSD